MKYIPLLLVIALLVMSFHAPTSTNFQAKAQELAIQTPKKPIVVNITLPTQEDVQAAVNRIRNRAEGFDVKIDDGHGNITSTRAVGGQVVETVQKADPVALKDAAVAFTQQRITNFRSLLASESSSTVKHQLELVDWAQKTSNIGACKDVLSAATGGDRVVDGALLPLPSAGDYLAFCVARITKVKERCNQIAAQIALPLKSLCEREIGLSPF